MKVKLAPGAFDGVPEDEQEELLLDIQKMVDDGTLFDESQPVDIQELKEEDPETYEKLMQALETKIH